MALENDKSPPNDVHSTNQGVEPQTEIESIAEVTQMLRYRRWSRREILVLIQGKNMAESLRREKRRSTSSNQAKSKWEVVSSFCKKNGMKKRAVQCQKRWSKLMVIFREIKKRESVIKEVAKSFWNMTSTERRGLKLPGFFDKDVYDALDGKLTSITLNQVILEATNDQWQEDDDTNDENTSKEIQVATHDPTKKISSVDKKEQVINCQEEASSEESYKRRRFSQNENEDFNMESQLIESIGQIYNILKTYFEANNVTEKSKEHKSALVNALNKIGDALEMIADKL
ncbi:trihelix transcription factor ASR3-like [Impatiens glandulifera]|uniref:trihelix transcription factor ASR3-like n=1 Tax=Impatiens glandulifera TaxID=253017 RepID=UPI001FB0BADE|nr:trihelix transcription factor ASR3-like [Impatiens glandulifera]